MAITTAEQLLRAQDAGRCELVRGEFIMMNPAGAEHGRITMNLSAPIAMHVRAHSLGTVVAAETGFLLSRDPDTVRAPDFAFLRGPHDVTRRGGFVPGSPDLAVEVLSPDDRPGYVRKKVSEWLEAGTLAVWVVDPRTRTVTIHEAKKPSIVLDEDDVLSCADLLPGFELAIRDVFA